MMIEPRSTATIRALASLAELSADQLEEGASIEEVIATLRKAAEAVRHVIDTDEADDAEFEDIDLVQDLTPMDLAVERSENNEEIEETEAEEPVLNAG
ncbi:MAG: hypothetical protein RIE06_10575 [Roseibium album]|uniref:Uncharacterized protein n=1 Tax=Roseibium album TaxID=311410 RepID=A0A0M6Z787_9HYPH|nr:MULTISPECIES: hypothetical protein [Stappiaceae]MBG6145606.1 hypothetical protein [Labrenzia sp. EL_142]MBG6163129.1 hypothetical protein [Labrenzia sp. EL_195]MBG6209007.1 hypothetical protein [Labrenzia sp. EL_126]CTQ58628.1 hypothetical protein LA5094_01389 [Roseibium album]CTQ67003.1 hypothetical protein LA5096_01299 [Roseibium album]